MMQLDKEVKRNLIGEIVATPDPNIFLMYSKWEDEGVTKFEYAYGTMKYLKSKFNKAIAPVGTSERVVKNRHHGKYADAKTYIVAVTNYGLEACRAIGGQDCSFDNEVFEPKKWGKALTSDYVMVAVSPSDHTIYYLDGSYANTSFGDYILERDWDFDGIKTLDADDDIPVYIYNPYGSGDGTYFVRGNGNTMNIVVKMTQEQYEEFRTARVELYNQIEFAMGVVGVDAAKYKKDND